MYFSFPSQHPLHALQVLVHKRGRGGDLGAIGGPWAPGDGGHPACDPGALVATARRTFLAATGVDLAPCTQVGSGVPLLQSTNISRDCEQDG